MGGIACGLLQSRMASSRQRRPQQKAPTPENQELQKQEQLPENEQLQQGPEMAPETATSLQSSVGNASLNAMLGSAGRMEAPELESEQEVEVDQEVEEAKTGAEEAFADLLGAMGARESMVASADVDDQQRLFGGDPTDEPPPARRAPRLPQYMEAPVIPAIAPTDEDPEEPVVHEMPLEMPPLGPVHAPSGDERLDALWAWLRDPYAAVGEDFEPESLVDDEGSLARVAHLAGFVERAFRSPLARSLASLGRPLPGGPGLAGQVARAGALVELGVLCEPVPVAIANRACACALENDAPIHARAAARLCMEERRLRADLVTEVALYGEADREPLIAAIDHPDDRGLALLAAGLATAANPAPIPSPGRHARPHAPDSTADGSTEDIDALLMEMTGGLPPSTEVDYQVLGPVLQGADNQLLFAGRTQVELASAGIALRRVAGREARDPVRQLLLAADRELRDIARQTALTSQQAEAQIGQPVEAARPHLEEAEHRLEALTARLRRLREACFEALATRHLAPEPKPPPPVTPSSTLTDLEALEACELIGAGLVLAEALEQGSLPPKDLARGLLRRGERLRRQADPDAARVLAQAARQAMVQGQQQLDWRARACTVRALAELGRQTDALALLPRVERDGRGLELQLARAALDQPGAHQALAELLGAHPRPGFAHDHVEGWMAVARGFGAEGRWEKADSAWAEAIRLCKAHGADTADLFLMRAATLIACGRPAQRFLEEALASSMTQVQLAASMLLSGQHLSQGHPRKALAASERVWNLAIARRSWHAFACAAIDRAAALDQLGRPDQGLSVLGQALGLCRLQGEPGALLQARLMELGARG